MEGLRVKGIKLLRYTVLMWKLVGASLADASCYPRSSCIYPYIMKRISSSMYHNQRKRYIRSIVRPSKIGLAIEATMLHCVKAKTDNLWQVSNEHIEVPSSDQANINLKDREALALAQ
jgi:hypothetical protein